MPRRKASSSSGSPRPQAFGGEDAVENVLIGRMRLGAPDASGRRAPEPDRARRSRATPTWSSRRSASTPRICRTLFGAPELGVTRWGTVLVDNKTLMTSLDGVFAAGDIVRGASLVVWAVRDGRDVAATYRQVSARESERGKESGMTDQRARLTAEGCIVPSRIRRMRRRARRRDRSNSRRAASCSRRSMR